MDIIVIIAVVDTVIMASMANIVALMLVGLIAILMEFVKICLKKINDRNMSKFFAAESNVKKKIVGF